VQELVSSLFSSSLTDEEREMRAEQNILAMENKARQVAELEDQASNLFAFTDVILGEITRTRDLGRFIEPDAMEQFVVTLLGRLYPGSTVQQSRDPKAAGALEAQLSSIAKQDLSDYISSTRLARRTRLHEPGRSTLITTNPRWSGQVRPRPELIDTSHPIVLWLREKAKSDSSLTYPLSAVELGHHSTAGIRPGLYVYMVDRWVFPGLRKEVHLKYAAIEASSGVTLDETEAERLVLHASKHGRDILQSELAKHSALIAQAVELLTNFMEEAFFEREETFEVENQSLLDRQIQAVQGRATAEIAQLEERLRSAEASSDEGQRRIIPAIRGRRDRARERFEMQMEKLQKAQDVSGKFNEIVAGVIIVN
jgi:hypothetical protein